MRVVRRTQVMEATPRELLEAGLYRTLAVDFVPGRAEEVSAAQFALALGAQRVVDKDMVKALSEDIEMRLSPKAFRRSAAPKKEVTISVAEEMKQAARARKEEKESEWHLAL